MSRRRPEILAARVPVPILRALQAVLASLPQPDRRALRARLAAAYIEDPARFVSGLLHTPLDVESVKKWRP